MRTDKSQLLDTVKRTIESRLDASDLGYMEVQIIEQYIMIQQNEEIISLLKEIQAK